jgi:predicted esterase
MHTPPDTLRFGPSLAQARGALILLHGRGSSAEDIARLAEALPAQDFACLAPSAANGTWYPQRFLAPLAQNEPWLGSALATVESLVSEAMAAGIPAGRIGLIGFSQGACLALEHAARAGRRYAFTAALSGALIGPLDTARPARELAGLPVLLGCAEHDAHIPLPYVEHSATVLTDMNAAVTKQVYPGAAHTVFAPEIDWITRRLAA